MRKATAFAPATIANVAVGFDVLGFSFDEVGDHVSVTLAEEGSIPDGVCISGIEGPDDLPLDPMRNTAAVALRAMRRDLGISACFSVELRKGIPIGSGMGGSAASAVGAVVAANALLDRSLPHEELLAWAIEGEIAASGDAHADNVAPCLHGGLTAVFPGDPPEILTLPVPEGLSCVLVRPQMRMDTREGRAALADTILLADHAEQSARLAGFIAGCFRGDARLMGRAMVDILVEPQRSGQIPGFDSARTAALDAGAIACSMAGSGPSIFAWCVEPDIADAVQSAIRASFEENSTVTDSWISAVPGSAARVLEQA